VPPSGATVSGTTVSLDASASPGTTQVQFVLNGETQSNAVIGMATPTIVGWLAGWNSTTVPNGVYTLQSVASYANGTSGTSTSIPIAVNNPPPTTFVLAPQNNAIVSGTSVALDASASAGTTLVQYVLNGGLELNTIIGTATPTIWGWAVVWNSTTVPNGTYTLQSVAYYANRANNGTSAAITITVSN
jgi:hypothetical protein